jgi:hypothetical protein
MKITVYAKTGAKTERVEKISSVEYKVFINQVPEGGKANIRIVELLSEYFDCPKSAIELTHGRRSKVKVFEVN